MRWEKMQRIQISADRERKRENQIMPYCKGVLPNPRNIFSLQ